MAYSIDSFSSEFVFGEGEPYDIEGACLNADGKPYTLWSAIITMSPGDWLRMCEDCFPGIDPKFVTPESVLELCQETNTCGTLTVPVDVWIDSEGYHKVLVYDE